MPYGNILVVEDEKKISALLKRIICLEGYTAFEATDLRSALKLIQKENIEVIVCDVKLPDGNGIEFTRNVKAKSGIIEIIILTAHANIPDSVQAMRNGAFDYIKKGDDNDKLIPLIGHALEKARLQKRVLQLEHQVTHNFSFENIIGKSPLFLQNIALAKKVAPTHTTVLLLGETGTGKELFARAIHFASKRSSQPFVALNCSAFTKSLLESEIFGHKMGAFTGATKDKKGLIEEANEGTLFLDEIGEMHLELQSKLLRVLEGSEFIKVGDTRLTKVNVRIIAATNRDLEKDVREGKFREDLFYRLNVFSIELTPLRDRKSDIPMLAEYFLHLFAKKANLPVESISRDFIECLERHDWRGNIRELKNVMERAVILATSPQLHVDNLPLDLQQPEYKRQPFLSTFNLSAMEKMHIQRVLSHARGNKAEAAKLLSIGLTTLYRKIEEYNLSQDTWGV
jgi:two-component system, NtrC family, response regulator